MNLFIVQQVQTSDLKEPNINYFHNQFFHSKSLPINSNEPCKKQLLKFNDIPNTKKTHKTTLLENGTCQYSNELNNDKTQLSIPKSCETDEYDIYCNSKKYAHGDSFHRRRTTGLYSPLHYHAGSNLSTSNRPNSRNSLNSRLSSSHNSLSVPTTNKADDSIFITQAMSHDALTGREITDFYNVPVDSDVYALPIDVIKPKTKEHKISGYKNLKGKLKYVRNTKKRRKPSHNDEYFDKMGYKTKVIKTVDKRHSAPENSIEPMHMTLDEVKRFYHSLYSTSSDSSEVLTKNVTLHTKTHVLASINNNNPEKNSKTYIHPDNSKCVSHKLNNKEPFNLKNKNSVTKVDNDKYDCNSAVKKSQFSVNFNLKQKLCSIFRFRRSTQNINGSQTLDRNEYETSRIVSGSNNTVFGKQERKVKFSTRALPPLPNKG